MVSDQQINQAAAILQSGGLVAFPTETVYGLGANALNPEAVAKIFIEKERPSFDPLIVHICQLDDLKKLCLNVDDRIYKLAEQFWPGPLTIVVPKSHLVPDIVTSGLPTVGIRMPRNEIALKLIKAAGFPVAAPSANKFGRISPTTAHHVKKQLPDVKCVLDGGSCSVGIESTVISLTSLGFKILREGIITKAEISKVIPYSDAADEESVPLASPGLLKSHYSPLKPIFILGKSEPVNKDYKNAGFISFSGMVLGDFKRVEYLSKTSDLKEAAVNLFDVLHRMEDSDVEFIVAEPVPEHGIGLAIMDRMGKAAYQYISTEHKQ